MTKDSLPPGPPASGAENKKVTRITFSPLPPMTTRDLKRYSPITPDERTRVEAAITRIDPDRMTPQRWQRLADALRKPLERVDRAAMAGYLEIGRWLVRVKAKARHGSWSCLFHGSPNAIEAPLALSVKKAQALMRFAEDPVLSNPKNWKRLPVESWQTMDELTRLGQTLNLQALINRGSIHPRTSIREVLALSRGEVPLVATTAKDRVTSTHGVEVDPLYDLECAHHFYAGPRLALIAWHREKLAELAMPDDGDHHQEDDA
jgi:hypothetical protein